MPRPEPYISRNPNDLLRSTDWNEIQVRTREEVQNHNHTGGEQGVPIGRAGIVPNAIDGTRVDPASLLTVTGLTVTGTFKVGARTLLSEVDSLLSRVGSLETKVASLETRASAVETRATNLETRATNLENSRVNRAGDTISGTLKTASLGVGLGTANPATRLEVKGTTSDTTASAVRVTNAGNGNLFEVRNDGAVFVGALSIHGPQAARASNFAGIQFPRDPGGGGGDTAFIRYFAETGETTRLQMGTENDGDDTVALWQAGAERLTVYNGNVGIGTRTPGYKLEVDGEVKINGGRLRNSGGYAIVETNANDWLRINPDNQFPATAHYKALAINGGGLAVGEWSVQPQGQLVVTADAHIRGNIAEAGGWLRDRYAAKDHRHDSLISDDGRYRLTMQADRNLVAYNPTGTAFWASNTATSDGTLKRDVAPIPDAMEGLRKLRGVSFFWKDEEMGTERELGVIAQEVEAVFPELVNLVDGKHRLVRYEKFVPVLIQALKEQDERICQLEGRLREVTF